MLLKSNHEGSPIAYYSLAIAISTSLSAEVNTSGFVLVAIRTPAAWDAAGLTFQGCEVTGGTFANVYDDAGTEYTVAASTSRYIILNPAAFAGFQFIKVRSGTASVPVTQTAARTLVLVFRKLHRNEGS